jgi:zeaxanthin glucosyltransferase
MTAVGPLGEATFDEDREVTRQLDQRSRHLRQKRAIFRIGAYVTPTMKIAFTSIPVPGHLNPMTALARKLQSRGHEIVFICLPDTEPVVRAANLAFLPCGEKEFPIGSVDEYVRGIGRRQGEEARQFTMGACAAATEAMLNSLPTMLNAEGVDALVLDAYQFYVELVPMSLGMPYVHVSNALHFDYSGYTPIHVYDWPHETGPEALARNRKGVANFLKTVSQANAGARAYAERVGLKIDLENPEATISKLAWLTQTPKEFDFESSHWPSQLRHTGPFHDGAGRIDVDFPWERLTGEPILYASMGTIHNRVANVFRTIAEAAAMLKDAQLILSIGNDLDPREIGPLPSNAIIVKRAPQLELLKRTSVCITHAGLNTVLEALAQGVPQVAIPVTNDQPGVAARIADKKTGLFVPVEELTASRLSVLVEEVLTDSTYRDRAGHFQKVIAETNGLSAAADLLEQAFGLNQKTSNGRATVQRQVKQQLSDGWLSVSKLDPVERKEKPIRKIAHPAIGEIYCLNEPEARGTLHEIWDDKLYFQEGISILPGDIVFDVGANIGVFTLCAAKQGARIYAYEPIPPTFELLQHNIRLHGFDHLAHAKNIGLSDRAEEKIMFHYPALSVCDSWTGQHGWFEFMAENWENTLDILKTADPDQYEAIRSLGSKSQQQGAVRELIDNISASSVGIKCKFDTLSGVIAQEHIQSIDLLKLDAEFADWEILNGVKAEDWNRIQQVAMEVHVQADVAPISKFLSERGFSHVTGKELKMATGCIWARK